MKEHFPIDWHLGMIREMDRFLNFTLDKLCTPVQLTIFIFNFFIFNREF